jgi:hypothetical protein
VVHHFDPARLRRSAWLEAARKRGRTDAYLLHHWQHGGLRNPRLGIVWLRAKLTLRRRLVRLPSLAEEGCPCWEMSYVMHIAKSQQFLIERCRPRNYPPRGLQRSGAAAQPQRRVALAHSEAGVARLEPFS